VLFGIRCAFIKFGPFVLAVTEFTCARFDHFLFTGVSATGDRQPPFNVGGILFYSLEFC
jgi:hypothetical protein